MNQVIDLPRTGMAVISALAANSYIKSKPHPLSPGTTVPVFGLLALGIVLSQTPGLACFSGVSSGVLAYLGMRFSFLE